ncbi:MAG TPA: 4-vinyl reductase [Lentisphaeria bacterium]|nr:MAG: 4-vinyl reductase [Lentisphaerae bacterium GWF2_50_93]HCE44608.1 4-vinyl reductase [Lentisphaeria bacterium]
MFKEERKETRFEWNMLGDIQAGRPNLGTTMDVAVYRLMQFTLRDVLIQKYGVKEADEIYFMAGEHAGKEFFSNLIKEKTDFNKFVLELKEVLEKLRIGIMRIEKADLENMKFTIVIAEDLDCSGLPVTDEEICTYDEGFLSGLLRSFTGAEFDVKEVDCWCSGDRVCRFSAERKD